jgi:hypothetical protein
MKEKSIDMNKSTFSVQKVSLYTRLDVLFRRTNGSHFALSKRETKPTRGYKTLLQLDTRIACAARTPSSRPSYVSFDIRGWACCFTQATLISRNRFYRARNSVTESAIEACGAWATVVGPPAMKAIELIGWLCFLSSHLRGLFLQATRYRQKSDLACSYSGQVSSAATIKNKANQSCYSVSSLAGGFATRFDAKMSELKEKTVFSATRVGYLGLCMFVAKWSALRVT